MSNMSYCRFHNTLSDLRDCAEVLQDGGLTDKDSEGHLLSKEEFFKACELVALVRDLTESMEGTDVETAYEEWCNATARQERREANND